MSHKPRVAWEIPPRGRECTRGHEALLPGAEVYSELKPGQEGVAQRSDFCAKCWVFEQQERDVAQSTHWRSVIPRIEEERDLRKEERGDHLLGWLREALAAQGDVGEREAFVLSLYLLRLRRLVRKQALVTQGSPCVLYEVVDTGEALLVPSVSMRADEIASLHEKLAERLRALGAVS